VGWLRQYRPKRGWQRAVLGHLVGDYRLVRAFGFSYRDMRYALRHPQARRKLPQLLEEADKLWEKVLQN